MNLFSVIQPDGSYRRHIKPRSLKGEKITARFENKPTFSIKTFNHRPATEKLMGRNPINPSLGRRANV